MRLGGNHLCGACIRVRMRSTEELHAICVIESPAAVMTRRAYTLEEVVRTDVSSGTAAPCNP